LGCEAHHIDIPHDMMDCKYHGSYERLSNCAG
jgi:hypothetical protein